MSKPEWLTEEVARQGTRLLEGAASRSGALTAIIKAVKAHPEYVADMLTADAERRLTRWLRERAAQDDSDQIPLFPEIPVRMKVTPKDIAEVASMTGEQLDKAKRILWARTQNQMDGAKSSAEHERSVFLDFYNQVRPLLGDGKTVAEAVEELAARKAA
jgi:phage/plasmid-associated DNA primase